MKRSKHHLCFLLLLYIFMVRSLAQDLTLNVNFDKPISVTNEKFLSLTVDPATLLTGSALSKDFEKSINLARALSPAYIRFEGPGRSFFRFADPDAKDKNRITILTESDWIRTHQWAKKSGLDVIACISPDYQRDETEDTREIVSFSDHVAFNTSWQLGYECQTGCNISASDLARQTVNLRKILNEFPRYSNSIVAGPDVVAYRSDKQRQYLRDYFDIASPALSAITWHPDLAGVTLDNEGAFIHEDNLEKDREELLKVIGRFVDKQPLWIAESKPEECKNLYIGALILARRLGNAARSKINVLMRQPTDLTHPSPDYWVSLLHKTLVGQKVFDVKIQSSSKNHVFLYCQCTKASNRYQRGSVTIFGVNLNPEETIIDLKGMKINTVHEYVLSPGFDSLNRMFSESVFLNNKTLNLINDTVPELYPVILKDPEGLELELHPGGIGFWVLPDLKIKSCMEDDASFNSSEDFQSEEELKVHVTRSVQDRSALKTEKKQKIDSEASRKSILKRELNKLRKYAKKRLNDYEITKSPLKSEDSSTSKAEDTKQESQNDIQNKLQEFKDRILRIRSISNSNKMKSRLNKVVSDVSSLVSKVQNALDPTKQEIDHSDKIKSPRSAKNHLKDLYDFLNRVNLNKPIGAIKQNRLFKRDVTEVIRPSVIEWDKSDSDEHTFYGFFKMNPAEGFPEGDVHFATAEHPEIRNNGRSEGTDSNVPAPEYDDYEEYEYDYPTRFDEPFFGRPRTLNDKSKISARRSVELWEAEGFPMRNGRSKREAKDLNAILDQEMIKEDDANSKDCKCRVIRHPQSCNCRPKRDIMKPIESVESATVSEVASLTSHDMADVEVFSELKEAPMEAVESEQNVPIDLEGIPSKIGVTPFTTPLISRETIGARSVNLEEINSGTLSTVSSSISKKGDESTRSHRTPIRGGRRKFFLKKSKQDETKETTIDTLEDPAEYSSNSWENSTSSSSNETATEEGEESSSTTFKSATLWEPDIAKEAEMDYNNDQAAVASSKRQVVNENVPKVSAKAANKSTSPSLKDFRRNRRQRPNRLNRKLKTNIAKARESRLMQRAKVLSALVKMIRGKTGDEVYKFRPKSRSRTKSGERSKTRKGQATINDKSPEKKNIILQQVQKSIDNEMNEMVNEKDRNLKRRHVWEMIDDDEDFKDVMDSEKLACVLVYNPTNDEDNESYESIEKRDAPITEIVRTTDIRERLFNPKNQRSHCDSTLMEHSDPDSVRKEIVELKDLYEKEAATIGESDEDDGDDGTTYFVLVENLDRPRFFRLQEKQRNVQKSSPRLRYSNNYRYNQPKKEIFVIDPSEYRGGEPILQPYRDPLKSRPNFRSRNLYEVIRKSLQKPYNIRTVEQRKREDKVTNEDVSETSEKLSENVNTGELLKVLIDNLDLQSVEELFKQLDKYNTTDEKRNFIRSIVEEMRKKRSEDEESSESMGNSRENESLEILNSEEVMDQTESYLDVSIEQDTQSNEDDTTFEVSIIGEHPPERIIGRRRRDTSTKPGKNYSKWFKSSKIMEILEKNEHFGRLPRQAVDQENINENADMVQPSVLQQLEGSSSPEIQTSTEMDDIEKSLVQKVPIERYTKKEDLNDENGLQSLIQKSIPSLQNVVVDSLQKARNFTGSVEELIENLDEKFDEATSGEDENNSINSRSITTTQAVFHNAITNVKKFFALLGGITRILQG
nr:uncharacterized protein LOC117603976 [Osmia lignaria]